MIFSVSRGVPNWPSWLEKVMIFGVSRGVPTDPLQEVMIFSVSRGVPTDPFEEIMIGWLRGAIQGSDKQTLHHNVYIIQVNTSHFSLSLQVKPLLSSHPIIFSAHWQQLGRQKVPNIAKENLAKYCQREFWDVVGLLVEMLQGCLRQDKDCHYLGLSVSLALTVESEQLEIWLRTTCGAKSSQANDLGTYLIDFLTFVGK